MSRSVIPVFHSAVVYLADQILIAGDVPKQDQAAKPKTLVRCAPLRCASSQGESCPLSGAWDFV